jgi:hypothetical protein
MDSGHWPAELRQQLGDTACAALVEVLDERDEMVLSLTTERFERRLGHECDQLRHDIRNLGTDLRADMKVLRSEIVAEIATTRADLIKWAFAFWAAQLISLIGWTSFAG